MSAIVEIDAIPLEKRKNMIAELSVKSISNKKGKSKYVKQTAFNVYDIIDDDHVTIPFSYYYHFIGGFPNALREAEKMSAKFRIPLFDRQLSIRQEAIEMLNKERSVVLSLFTGFGKCLAPDIPVLMWDGSVKAAKTIKVGDQLIGDDSTPRNVLSVCSGRDQMYKITQGNGDSYTVNEPHILSLYIVEHRSFFWDQSYNYYVFSWFDRVSMCYRNMTFTVDEKNNKTKSDALEALQVFKETIDPSEILDISVYDYLQLNTETKKHLKGFKVGVNFSRQDVNIHPRSLGVWLGRRAYVERMFTNITNQLSTKIIQCKEKCNWDRDWAHCKHKKNCKTDQFERGLIQYDLVNNNHIPREYLINDRETRLELLAGLLDTNGYYNKGRFTLIYRNKTLFDNTIYLIRSLGFETIQRKNNREYVCTFSGYNVGQIPCSVDYNKVDNNTEEKIPHTNAILTSISIEPLGDGDYYGFTIDGNHRFLLGDFTVTHNTLFAIYLACKIGYKTIIFCHRVVIIDQWVKSIKKACGDDTIVQIVTAKNKIDPNAQFYVINVSTVPKRDRNDFSHVATCIADEMHCLCTEKFTRSFSYVFPKYLIGCTATPVRSDGQDRVIELFAGVNIIYRPLHALFNVYLYHTAFKPKIEKTSDGDMIWGSVIDSQATDISRNTLIVDIVRYFCTRNILVLCKLKKHATIIAEVLEKYNESVDTYMGSQKVVNFDSRVLVATYSKSGVGMDHPKLDMLLLAGDCEENWMQYLGRVFRREHHIPIIVDLIDSKFRPLKNHSDTRITACKEAGGEIKNLVNHFPQFEEWRTLFNTQMD